MALLEFKKISKSFGSIEAIKDISFKVSEGEFVFITGPSGAGKTTLLKLLTRQIRPSSGEIVYDGKEIHTLKKREIPVLRQSVGVVFQDFKLLAEKTIRENVEVSLAIAKIPQEERTSRVEHVMDLVGLTERMELFPSQLSGGELQRASLARALVTNPKLIFADEPTGNLDWETAEGVMKLLEKINKEGKTIIITTHHEKIVKEYAKRILQIKGGKLISDSK